MVKKQALDKPKSVKAVALHAERRAESGCDFATAQKNPKKPPFPELNGYSWRLRRGTGQSTFHWSEGGPKCSWERAMECVKALLMDERKLGVNWSDEFITQYLDAHATYPVQNNYACDEYVGRNNVSGKETCSSSAEVTFSEVEQIESVHENNLDKAVSNRKCYT